MLRIIQDAHVKAYEQARVVELVTVYRGIAAMSENTDLFDLFGRADALSARLRAAHPALIREGEQGALLAQVDAMANSCRRSLDWI